MDLWRKQNSLTQFIVFNEWKYGNCDRNYHVYFLQIYIHTINYLQAIYLKKKQPKQHMYPNNFMTDNT